MPTIDSTDQGFQDYLTGVNTGVAYNGMSAVGASHHKPATGSNVTATPVHPQGQSTGFAVSLPTSADPVWLRIVTGALVVEGIEFLGFIGSEALKQRATFFAAILCGLAALVYGYLVGVPAMLSAQVSYSEAVLGLLVFALPYAALITLVLASTILGTLVTAVLVLTLNLLRLAIGFAIIAAIGYAIYYVVTQS